VTYPRYKYDNLKDVYAENNAVFCITLHGEAKIINVDIRHIFVEILKGDALFSTIKRLQKYGRKHTYKGELVTE
jgi:hypothetical protein